MNSPLKIIITGPESTGKSTLAAQLAAEYKAGYVPEYARAYVEKLNRPYAYFDLVNIAKKQMEELTKKRSADMSAVFFDTGPEISQIWFREVYRKVPAFFSQFVNAFRADLYLLCQTDLQWKADPARENGGSKREYLFFEYEKFLKKRQFNYVIISGIGKKRLITAKKILASAYHLQKNITKNNSL